MPFYLFISFLDLKVLPNQKIHEIPVLNKMWSFELNLIALSDKFIGVDTNWGVKNPKIVKLIQSDTKQKFLVISKKEI